MDDLVPTIPSLPSPEKNRASFKLAFFSLGGSIVSVCLEFFIQVRGVISIFLSRVALGGIVVSLTVLGYALAYNLGWRYKKLLTFAWAVVVLFAVIAIDRAFPIPFLWQSSHKWRNDQILPPYRPEVTTAHTNNDTLIELAPYIVVHRTNVNMPTNLGTAKFVGYGLSVILRLHRQGATPNYVHSLAVRGDIEANCLPLVKDGSDLKTILQECRDQRAFNRLSWILYPSKETSGDEQFAVFQLVDGKDGGSQGLPGFHFYGEAGDINRFFGSGSTPPAALVRTPYLDGLIAFGARTPDGSELRSPRLRPEVLNGRVKFYAKTEQELPISADQITPVGFSDASTWDASNPAEMFSQAKYGDPAMPSSVDPRLGNK